ncbi:acetylcholinesterase [Leptodontidium sp. 2 PMI_412]|nr:acetylcholinesterase [Leptodontidium sp. 2 PMI_412]
MHHFNAVVFAFLASTVVAGRTPPSENLPVVDLGYELYRATEFNQTRGYYNFSNIRYASPPLGDLRFRAPVLPATNRSVIQDGSVTRICPQATPSWLVEAGVWAFPYIVSGTIPNITYSLTTPNNDSLPITRDPRENEDCLFLDVMVPKKVFENAGPGAKAPVMVYIYGGGYTAGTKSEIDPVGLMARSRDHSPNGVIYVGMNYRLGAFGFLSGPTFQKDGTANAGLYDQRLALEWVQTNIHLFGGDKTRVTVFGGSAGAGSIMHQITAFGGLKSPPFQQLILQSPGWTPRPGPDQQDNYFRTFLANANASDLAELRKLPSDVLMYANALQVVRSPYGTFTFGPTIDGKFVTQDPRTLLNRGQFPKSLKALVAHNMDEGIGFSPPSSSNALYLDLIKSILPLADRSVIDLMVDDFYPPIFDGSELYHDQIARAALTVTESTFSCKSFSVGSTFSHSFGYVFDVFPATHGFDSQYVFYDPETSSALNLTIAYAIQDYVTTFAIGGIPHSSVDGLPGFPSYGKKGNVVMLGDTGISTTTDPAANERCKWWNLNLSTN